MLVAEILKAKGGAVHTLEPTTSLAAVCAELEKRRIGAIIICEDDRVAGVLSERDIVRAVALDGGTALDRQAADYMTRDVIFAEPSETVAALLERMTDRRIRHLPVLESNRLIGVVSIGDLVKHQIAETIHEAESLRTYIASG